MLHKSFLIYPVLLLLLSGLTACEDSEQHSSERIVFNVSAEEGQSNFRTSSSPSRYIITTDGSAFFSQSGAQSEPDKIFSPNRLEINIILQGDLIPSLLDNPNGYRVRTQFELEGGIIIIDHTNQASSLTDSLYAIRGEGIVSGGDDLFKNISGFFFEESTFRIQGDDSPGVNKITCRYELTIDF